jgi:predicted ester cyclase
MTIDNATRTARIAELIRIGELEVSGDHPDDVDAYFAPGFVFHDADGSTRTYGELQSYFASLRAAFDDLTITRGIIVVDDDMISCQTWIEGDFTATFTHSPVGAVEPNGEHVVFALHNFFRYDDQGRLAEEWIQTDRRNTLAQLGATGRG